MFACGLDNGYRGVELEWLDELRIWEVQRRQRKVAISGASSSNLLHGLQGCNSVPENSFFCNCYGFPYFSGSLFFLSWVYCFNGAFAFLHKLWDKIGCVKWLLQHLLNEWQAQKPTCSFVILLQDLCQPCKTQPFLVF